MATKTISLSSQYRLQLVANLKSQNQSAKTSDISYSLKVIRASGSGYWSYERTSWTMRLPYSNTFRSGGTNGFDFRNYTTLTLASGTVTTGRTGSVEIAGVFNDGGGGIGSGSARLNLSIPAFKPPATTPDKPTNLSASRQTDKSIRVTWSRPGVYPGGMQAQRSTNGSSGWAQVARPGGSSNAFTDTSTTANQRYYYRIRGYGSTGLVSSWSNVAGPVYTTPAAPSNISAKRSGSSIIVSAGSTPPYATSYDIEDNGSVVATSVSLPWTHSSPSTAVTHRYRIRSKRGSLTSGWSAYSSYVQLLTPPAAPSKLSPNGATVPADETVRLSWQHNPIDSSDQVSAEIRYHALEDPSWETTLTVDEYYDIVPTSGEYEWQVRTKGSHADFGPWSATATYTAINKPTVSIIQPGDIWDTARLHVIWEYAQSEGRVQGRWRVTLYDAEGTQLEQKTSTGDASETTLSTRVVDGAEYSVTVEVSTSGIWSEPTQQLFLVEFIPPREPQVDYAWDDDNGAAFLTIAPGEPEEGEIPGIPDTTSIMVERSLDGGETWELVADNLEPEADITDYEARSYGETMYRVTAFASTGASSETIGSLFTDSEAVWLSGGNSFEQVARLPYNTIPKIKAGRERTTHQFEHRSLPVSYAAAAIYREVAFSATIIEDDEQVVSRDELITIAQLPQPVHLYRDPTGNHIYGSISHATGKPQSSVTGTRRVDTGSTETSESDP